MAVGSDAKVTIGNAAAAISSFNLSLTRFGEAMERAAMAFAALPRAPRMPPGFPPFDSRESLLIAADWWEEHGHEGEAQLCKLWAEAPGASLDTNYSSARLMAFEFEKQIQAIRDRYFAPRNTADTTARPADVV